MSRRIPVFFGHNQRLVNVNFDDFDKTKEAIRQKWKLSGDFVLQAPYGSKGEYMDIVDNDDLKDFRDVDSLTVHLLDRPPGAAAGPNVGPTPPPSYEQSVQTATSTPQPQPQPQPKYVDKKMTVKYEDSRKLVTIDTQNLQNTKQAIRQKIPAVPDTFDLFAETPGQEDTLINNDADLSQCKDAKAFLVRRPMVQSSTPKPGKTISAKSNEKRVTVIHEGKQKFVPVDFESLFATKEEICRRFNLSGDIDVLGQLPDSEEKYDIENDTDLMDFKDAVTFHVRAHPSARQASSPEGRDTNTPHKPRNDRATPTEQQTHLKSLPVSYRGRRKSVTVKLDNVDNIRTTIMQRFKIEGDFSLKVKVGMDDYLDIENENDLGELRAAKELVVEDIDSTPSSQQIALVANKTQDLYLEGEGKTALIQYRDTTYGLYQPPPPESQVVLDQKVVLNETLNIVKLVDKMELTADFLRLAYFGVLGNKELHKKIQKMQFDVAELSKQCSSTAAQFKIKAEDVIENLECGFTYLCEGNNDFALENFKQIAAISNEVLGKTKTLTDKMEQTEEELAQLLQVISDEYRGNLPAGPQPITSAATEKHLRSRIEKDAEAFSQLRDQYRRFEAGVTKSKSEIAGAEKSKKSTDVFFHWLQQGFVRKSELDSVVSDKEKMLRIMSDEERMMELEKIGRARLEDQKANRELLETVEALKKAHTLSGGEGMLNMAMRGAETGVKSLQAALKPVIKFWEDLAVKCQSIANKRTVARMEKAATDAKSTEENKAFWTQPGFKREALRFFARWVALRALCSDFQNGMERVADGIFLCIQDNPSVDEARKRIKDLLTEVDARVQREEEALKKQ